MFVTPGYAQDNAPAAGGGEAPAAGDAHAPAAGEVHAGTEAGHEGGSFPPFDSSTYPSQLLWLAITFGLFYLFLKKVLLPQVGNILEVRAARIASDLEEASRLKEEGDAAVAAYEQELAEAKVRANAIGQQARDAAKADADAERRKVEAELGGRLSEAEAHIASIKSRAMAEVGGIAEETSAAIVEQLTGGKADRAALADAVRLARL
jgi:F-type H+-transporting ATPase subunit b